MIDVVYPLANNSKFRDDWELRYSLRSLQQQDWVRHIYLVGHCPGWIKAVTHITCDDPYTSCKDANIINKIILACTCRHLSDQFLVNSDDQYILKPIDVYDLEPVLENPCRLSEFKAKQGMNTWHKRVVDTVQWCVKNSLPEWIFQSHVPYVVDKEDYVAVMSQIPWGKGNGFTTHIYLNLTREQTPCKEDKGRTLRVKGRINPEELRAQVSQAIFFNHNDSGLTPIVKNFLEEHFPVPSRWER